MNLEKKILHITVRIGASTSKHSFEVETVIAGRNPESPLPLNHKDVSRKHMGLYVQGTDVLIEDLGSTNGTFLNGEELVAGTPAPLLAGSELVIGDEFLCKFKLEFLP